MNENYQFDEDAFDVSDGDYSDDGDAETLPCPECGQPIYEEAEQCPHCGQYVSFSSHAFDHKPWWWMVLGLLGVLALLWWLVTAGG